MSDTRTILIEHVAEGQDNPLYGGQYAVTAGRLPGGGGCRTNVISAKVLDNHFLIVDTEFASDSTLEKILGVVDIDKPQEAEERMYQEAKKIAEERAIFDRNTVIDITSKTTSLPPGAKHYMPYGLRSYGGCRTIAALLEKLKKKQSA